MPECRGISNHGNEALDALGQALRVRLAAASLTEPHKAHSLFWPDVVT